jgi:spermidine synthase
MTRPRQTRAARNGGPAAGPALPAALLVLFFCSGALALVYEVLWQRRFALVFGAAAPATAAVLAAYFAGLGVGSRLLGRAARRFPRPLLAYAVLEALVGLGALAVGPLSTVAAGWSSGSCLSTHPGALLAARTAGAFLAMALPTFCMGGTLPVLAAMADHGRRRLGVSAGLLYVVNTAGAAVGALSVPFVLLPAFGARDALWLCAAANMAVAVLAWRMDRSFAPGEPPPSIPDASAGRGPAPSMRLILVYSLLSGLVTFAIQVLWNRAFALVHESSVHAFAVIVAVFILALAVGGQLARAGLGRGLAPEALLGWAWMAAGALVAGGPWLFLRMTGGLAYLPADGGSGEYARRLVLLAMSVVFPAVAAIGVSLPTLMERAGRMPGASAGELLGRLLAWNVAGCVIGALVAGFVLPHTLGLWRSMELSALVLMAAGVLALAFGAGGAKRSRLALGTAVAFAGVLALWPQWTPDRPRVRVASSEGERLIAVSEGPHGIVAVVERPGSRRLKLDNHYALGGTLATGDERMQAHVPLLLHPSPRRVAALGLGTGISAGGTLFHPVEALTLVEIVPEVAEAARVHFRDANAGVLEDSRARLVVDDARSYLRGTSERFDVLVGDLVVPWRRGEGSLLTVEHFRAARGALAPGGSFCQWLPLFQLSEPELEIVLRTFLSVFPRAQVWRGDFSADEPALALVGGLDPFDLSPAVVRRRLGEMRPDPSNAHVADPRAFWMYFVGVLGPEDVPAGDGSINSEDHPWIELIGPQRHGHAPFTGRALQTWLTELTRRSAGRVRGLGAEETAGIAAGELLLEFSLALSEGNEDAARTAEARIRSLLSPQAFDAIFSDVGSP